MYSPRGKLLTKTKPRLEGEREPGPRGQFMESGFGSPVSSEMRASCEESASDCRGGGLKASAHDAQNSHQPIVRQ
jgi:hypothetical protein